MEGKTSRPILPNDPFHTITLKGMGPFDGIEADVYEIVNALILLIASTEITLENQEQYTKELILDGMKRNSEAYREILGDALADAFVQVVTDGKKPLGR